MDLLDQALSRIERSGQFDLASPPDRQLQSNDIIEYYRQSHIGYRLFHSHAGAIHMAISSDGKFRQSDYLAQAKLVNKYINQDTRTVLELACGNGFNAKYLAKKHPDVQFTAIDFTPAHVSNAKKRTKSLANITIATADFHKLPFEDASFDVLFVVESLCHANDMKLAISQAHRCLKPGGTLIVIDGYRTEQFESLPDTVKQASRLIEASMGLNHFYEYPTWRAIAVNSGFTVASEDNLTDNVLPNVFRLQQWAIVYFKLRPINWLAAKIFPPKLLQNAVAGLLMPYTFKAGAHSYWATVLTKPH